jgi:glycosyltransferase involved in cell wall biosynthesis
MFMKKSEIEIPKNKVDYDFSIVIAVYKNAESLTNLFHELEETLSKITGRCQVVFVVDGSPDNSRNLIISLLPMSNADVEVVNLSRNFGPISAVRTGLRVATGECVAVIAADLQEPTQILQEFYNELKNPEIDIVVGNRVTRKDPFVTKVTSRIFWNFYRRTINREIPVNGVDVFGCKKRVSEQIVDFGETGTSLIALLYWVGYKRTSVDYERKMRPFGKSSWTFSKRIRYLSDSVFAFTELPIRMLQILGILGIFGASILGFVTAIGWLSGNIASPGFTTLLLAILMSTSSILLGLGIVGEYAWRAFENTKSRPVSVIEGISRYKSKGK